MLPLLLAKESLALVEPELDFAFVSLLAVAFVSLLAVALVSLFAVAFWFELDEAPLEFEAP